MPLGASRPRSYHRARNLDTRGIAGSFPHTEFEVTKRLTTINHGDEKDVFATNGKTLVKPGYLAVYARVPSVAAEKDEQAARGFFVPMRIQRSNQIVPRFKPQDVVGWRNAPIH